MAHSHLGLNFDSAGLSQASTSGLQFLPQSQQVQQQQQQQQHQQLNPGDAVSPPPHLEPANPAQPLPAPAENPVLNAPAVGRFLAPAEPVAPQPIAQVAQQCTAESAALRAWLAQLEADGNEVLPHAGTAPPILFVNQIVIDRA